MKSLTQLQSEHIDIYNVERFLIKIQKEIETNFKTRRLTFKLYKNLYNDFEIQKIRDILYEKGFMIECSFEQYKVNRQHDLYEEYTLKW